MSYKKKLLVDILAKSEYVFSTAEEGVFVTELPHLKTQIFVFYHPDYDNVKIILRYMAFVDKFREVRLEFEVNQYKINNTLDFFKDDIFPDIESGILASKIGSDNKAEDSQFALVMEEVDMKRYFESEKQVLSFIENITPNLKQGKMTLLKLGKRNKAISTFTFTEDGYQHDILGK